jgi:hypothetical protein
MFLTLLNDGHCSDSDTLLVRAEIAKFEFINANDAQFGEICLGESLEIKLAIKNVTGIDVLIKDVNLLHSSSEIKMSNSNNILVKKDEIIELKCL